MNDALMKPFSGMMTPSQLGSRLCPESLAIVIGPILWGHSVVIVVVVVVVVDIDAQAACDETIATPGEW